MSMTRREFGKLAALAAPAIGSLAPVAAMAQAAKPNSKWAGVQVGMNVPYNFKTGNYTSGDDILARCIQLNCSGVEMRSQPVELFMGGPGQGAPAADLAKWRETAPAALGKARDFRKKYEDAGVKIEIVKYDGILNFTDPVLDYAFELAKTLGARAISCELPVNQVESARRMGQFADKHDLLIGFHGHTQMTPAIWEAAFVFSKRIGANLDIGHFVGGNKTSPVPFLKQYHDRITHLHIKDKTLDDKNVEFGKGDTPVKETLQLIRDNKWNIQATIEFEYAVPQGSDVMKELAKCMEFCRQCLV